MHNSIIRMANVVAKGLRMVLKVVECWATKQTLIEWYEGECRKDTLVMIFVVHAVDGDLYTYVEQLIVHDSPSISKALEAAKSKVGSSVTSGYIIVEDKLIKEIVTQHATM